MGDAYILYLICLSLMLTAGVFAQVLWPTAGLAFTLLMLLLVPAIVFVRIRGLPVRTGLRLNPVTPGVAGLAILTGAAAWSVAVMLHESISWMIGPPLDIGPGISNVSAYLTLLATAAVLPGICEECLFRGAVQGALERRGPWFGVLVAGIMFGIMHLDPWRILPAAFLGCVFGWMTLRTQSIVPAILGHISNNTTAISSNYLLRDPDRFPVWWLLVLAVVFLVSVGLFRRTTRVSEDFLPANPLALVPSGIASPVARAAGWVVVLCGLAVAGIALLIASILTSVKMNDDLLAPHIRAGDTLVLIRKDSVAFDMNLGDTISFRRGDVIESRVFIRQEGNSVYVKGVDRELRIDLQDVVGKMLRVMPAQ